MVVKKALVKTYGSKTMCPKWHFGQVGCEAKIPKGGFLERIVLVKKPMVEYEEHFYIKHQTNLNFVHSKKGQILFNCQMLTIHS